MLILTQDVQHTISVKLRHHDIANDQVGLVGFCQLYSRFAIVRKQYFIVNHFQDTFDVLCHFDVVLDEQNGVGLHGNREGFVIVCRTLE